MARYNIPKSGDWVKNALENSIKKEELSEDFEVNEDGKVINSTKIAPSVHIVAIDEADRLSTPQSTNLIRCIQADDSDYQYLLNANLDPSVAGNWIQERRAQDWRGEDMAYRDDTEAMDVALVVNNNEIHTIPFSSGAGAQSTPTAKPIQVNADNSYITDEVTGEKYFVAIKDSTFYIKDENGNAGSAITFGDATERIKGVYSEDADVQNIASEKIGTKAFKLKDRTIGLMNELFFQNNQLYQSCDGETRLVSSGGGTAYDYEGEKTGAWADAGVGTADDAFPNYNDSTGWSVGIVVDKYSDQTAVSAEGSRFVLSGSDDYYVKNLSNTYSKTYSFEDSRGVGVLNVDNTTNWQRLGKMGGNNQADAALPCPATADWTAKIKVRDNDTNRLMYVTMQCWQGDPGVRVKHKIVAP